MRTRHHPMKWPFSIGLALVLFLSAIFLVPQEWIDFFFSPLNIAELKENDEPAQWLNILPPLTLETFQEAIELPEETILSPKAPLAEDPRWWTQGWKVQTVNEAQLLMDSSPIDSVAVVLNALGVGLDFTRKALPDSILNHQLMLLKIEDGFAFEELKPYLRTLTKARALMDIKSRAADMYDEHLGSIIMVPD